MSGQEAIADGRLLYEIDDVQALSDVAFSAAFERTAEAARNGEIESKFSVWHNNNVLSQERMNDLGASEEEQIQWLVDYVDESYLEDAKGGFELAPINDSGQLFHKDNTPIAMFYLAQDVYENGNDSWDSEGLLYDALLVELDRLQITGDPEADNAQLERVSYLLGAGDSEFSNSEWGRYVADRTRDALEEMQQEISSQDNSLNRESLNVSGNYKTQALEEAAAKGTKKEEDAQKLSMILRYMDDVSTRSTFELENS
ncbi:MAG: hypothetical protein ACRBCK_08010 [Alphaproteobacteria bacterium]